MKKIIIAMAAIAAAFTMASCNKEQPVSPNENTTVGKSVITASIENDLTKTTLEGNDDEGYKVFWSAGDNLFVGDYWEEDWCAEYKLDNTSAGSSNGVFSWQDGNFFYSASEGGEKKYDEPIFEKNTSYEAFYPLDFFNINDDGTIEGGLTWKTEQTYSTTDRYIPMYAITECAKEGEANFNFTNLGGLLRLTVKGTEEIARITIQANEPMSGDVNLIEDAEGNMVAEIVGGYPFWKNEVTLNCSNDRVALTEAGTDFYISLPCYMNSKKENNGYSGVTITLANAKGETCVKKLSSSKNLVIERSKITTATFTASEFKANVPEGALPGIFSVSETKKVHFSRGNLYYDGSNWGFEAEQYYFRTYNGNGKCDKDGYSSSTGTASGHWGLFGWSTEGENFGMSTSTSSSDYSGNFLDWGTTIDNKGTWTTLSGGSDGEWKYLFDHHVNVWGTCNSVPGRFIAPDGFVGDVSALSDAIKDWGSAQAAGIVFLPAAGGRYGSNVFDVGDYGLYWSSSAIDEYSAYNMYFDSLDVYPDILDYRNDGSSVRLITESK